MAQYTVYSSGDAGAPTLSGTVGSIVGVLDACLVNGFGTKAAAGWTKAFSGTNKAVYLPGAGPQLYYRVDNNNPGTSYARTARLTGYAGMTDVDTGTGPFPPTAQVLGICASSTNDAVARPWLVFADNRTCYIYTFFTGLVFTSAGFGQFRALNPSDTINAMVFGPPAYNVVISTNSHAGLYHSTSLTDATRVCWAASTMGGIPGSTEVLFLGDRSGNSSAGQFTGAYTYPNGPDNSMLLAPIRITEGPSVRGALRGLYQVCHAVSNFSNGQTFSGSNTLTGKTFQLVLPALPNSASVFAVDISDTLEV